MGDFTVCGFYSRLPIEQGEETIAIICHDDLELKPSNIPCYSRSSIIPYCLPIYGEMGDYGALDSVKESETTKALEKLCGKPILEILETLTRVCCWGDDEEEEKELFKKLDSEPIWDLGMRESGHRFYVIYEHKSVYLRIVGQVSITEAHEKYLNIIKGNKLGFNIFSDNLMAAYELTSKFSGFTDFIKWVREDNSSRYRYKVNDLISNYYGAAKMLLYDKVRYTVDQNMVDEIIKWAGFLLHFDYYCHGLFTFSSSSGQNWHHDEGYKRFRKELLDEYKMIIDKYNE